MPRIIVSSDHGPDAGAILLAERVSAADFESQHFSRALIERLGWAVADADADTEADADDGSRGERAHAVRPRTRQHARAHAGVQ